jgi:hypothetical protein
MAVIAPPPAPVKPAPPARANGHPPLLGNGGNGHGGHNGNGNGHSDGHEGSDDAPRPPKKRRSIWPFLLDLGLVMMLFGLIITGRFLIVIGAVIFVVALTGWIREARNDFSGLAD